MLVELFIAVGAPVLRGIAGWLINALEDQKIDWPEWRRLVGTILTLGIPALALFYGFNLDAEYAASIVVVIDMLLSQIRKTATAVKQAATV